MTLFESKRKTIEELDQEWIQQWYMKSKSDNSKDGAIKSLKWIKRFFQESFPNKPTMEIIEELKALGNDTRIYSFVNNYVQMLIQNEKAFKTVDLYQTYFLSYLRFFGIRIYKEDIKQFIKKPRQVKEMREPITPEIIKNLLEHSDHILQTVILVAMSSGARISEILQSTVGDYDYSSRPKRMRIRALTTKTREAHETYISEQASEHLRIYLEGKQSNDLVFVKSYTKHTVPNWEVKFAKVRKKCGYEGKYLTGVHHITIHGFRSFFLTQSTKVPREGYGHSLTGHHAYLAQYFRLEKKDKDDLYLILEPHVTIKFKSL